MFGQQHNSSVVYWWRVGLSLFMGLLLSSFFLVSCSGFNFGGGSSSPTAKPTPSQVALSKLHWCNKPFIVFRDLHAPVTGTPTATATTGATPGATATTTTTASGTPTATTTPTPSTDGSPTTVTEWSQVEPNLGFTVYLPSMLPRTACLVSAYGTLHDPIFGGNFIIGYQLADGTPISLSEAPMRTNSRTFQCTTTKEASKSSSGTPTPTATTQVPLLLCTGARDTTNIVFSTRGSEASLQQFFNALQPNVNWVPAS